MVVTTRRVQRLQGTFIRGFFKMLLLQSIQDNAFERNVQKFTAIPNSSKRGKTSLVLCYYRTIGSWM